MDPEATFKCWLHDTRNVLAFTGAGVSAESGVPTFRGAGGLWEGHPVESVATPEGWQRDPVRVWRFYAARQAGLQGVLPNAAHHALAGLERRKGRFLLVTQNVDDLHERAGSRELIKLHGSLMETRCTGCGRVQTLQSPIPLPEVEAGRLPRCDCGALLRPNVVWFGELLDQAHFQRVAGFFQHCPAPLGEGGETLLLIVGTSGIVSAGYGLPGLARRYGARIVEINPEETELSEEADLVLRVPAAALFARLQN